MMTVSESASLYAIDATRVHQTLASMASSRDHITQVTPSSRPPSNYPPNQPKTSTS